MLDENKIDCAGRNIVYKKICNEVLAGETDFDVIRDKLKFARECGGCNDFIRHPVRDFIEELEEK